MAFVVCVCVCGGGGGLAAWGAGAGLAGCVLLWMRLITRCMKHHLGYCAGILKYACSMIALS